LCLGCFRSGADVATVDDMDMDMGMGLGLNQQQDGGNEQQWESEWKRHDNRRLNASHVME